VNVVTFVSQYPSFRRVEKSGKKANKLRGKKQNNKKLVI
jgi:hypothetical protein